MGFFNRNKKDDNRIVFDELVIISDPNESVSEERLSWRFLYGVLQGQKITIRVDTKYDSAIYKHTYYFQMKYSKNPTKELPDKEFLDAVYMMEKGLNEVLHKVSGDKIVYLGCATFGGSSYLTYASDYNIKWEEMLKHYFDFKELEDVVDCGKYLNDNMGYYNKVLYPKEVRE